MRSPVRALLLLSVCVFGSIGCGDSSTAKLPVPYFAGKTPVDIVKQGEVTTYRFNVDEPLATFFGTFRPLAKQDGWTETQMNNGGFMFSKDPASARVVIYMFDKCRFQKGVPIFQPSNGCVIVVYQW